MRFSRLLCLLSLPLLLDACAGARGFWNPNRSDRHGLARGRWRTYHDDANQHLFTSGQYRHGRPVRTFRYLSPTGVLEKSEVYGRDGFCEVTYWYPDGKVARRGKAQWVTGKGQTPRFYWYGPWTSYAQDGQITAVQTYTDGTITRAEQYENGKLTQVETYDHNKATRTETYQDGQLLKVETFEKGLRTGATDTL
jgi:antitoxin component YwqK of YwqJK toxin-antitoxin module